MSKLVKILENLITLHEINSSLDLCTLATEPQAVNSRPCYKEGQHQIRCTECPLSHGRLADLRESLNKAKTWELIE